MGGVFGEKESGLGQFGALGEWLIGERGGGEAFT